MSSCAAPNPSWKGFGEVLVRATSYDVVIPTVGRPSLRRLLEGLVLAQAAPRRLTVVFDRPGDPSVESVRQQVAQAAEQLGTPYDVLVGRGTGPAAARNLGWRLGSAEWVEFLDDDVEPDEYWGRGIELDLVACDERVGGIDGRIRVPRTSCDVPTEWERQVRGLESAVWTTADMAYRRRVLDEVGGFDERFAATCRADADLALRVIGRGHRMALGSRQVTHVVGPADWWASVQAQRSKAADVLMRVVHGPQWRSKARVPRGRGAWHIATVACAALAAALFAVGLRELGIVAAIVWGWLTWELAWQRIEPGPRTRREVVAMLVTSAVVPFAAVVQWLRGWADVGLARLTAGGIRPWDPAMAAAFRSWPAVRAVLFDRDGTLVRDVPYNGDPDLVEPLPGAVAAVRAARKAGLRVGVITNQSAVGRGLITAEDMHAVHRRIEELFGEFDGWFVCTHAPSQACSCRKPAPGLVLRASQAFGVPPERLGVIGDIGTDVQAALAASAHPVLVPTSTTLPAEVDAAPHVAPDLATAIRQLTGGIR